MFHKRNVKTGSKDLKRYPQISRRVRDTLARLLSLSLYYMYTRDNGVPIGLFRQFRLDL